MNPPPKEIEVCLQCRGARAIGELHECHPHNLILPVRVYSEEVSPFLLDVPIKGLMNKRHGHTIAETIRHEEEKRAWKKKYNLSYYWQYGKKRREERFGWKKHKIWGRNTDILES